MSQTQSHGFTACRNTNIDLEHSPGSYHLLISCTASKMQKKRKKKKEQKCHENNLMCQRSTYSSHAASVSPRFSLVRVNYIGSARCVIVRPLCVQLFALSGYSLSVSVSLCMVRTLRQVSPVAASQVCTLSTTMFGNADHAIDSRRSCPPYSPRMLLEHTRYIRAFGSHLAQT